MKKALKTTIEKVFSQRISLSYWPGVEFNLFWKVETQLKKKTFSTSLAQKSSVNSNIRADQD
jgi:hypothetical protein